MTFKPLRKQICVKPIERDHTLSSGIIVPHKNSTERAQEGIIESVGDDVFNPLLVPGARIYFGKFSTDAVPGYLILRETDVLAVINDGRIKPVNRFLVKMLEVHDDHEHMKGPALKGLGLVTVDRKKHWDHPGRRGQIVAADPDLETEVVVGDVVLFEGSSGFTLDGDVLDQDFWDQDQTVKGESYRWIKNKEIDAIDVAETEKRKQQPLEVLSCPV